MKKSILALTLVVVFGLMLFAYEAKAQMGPGMMGQGSGMGPGMMGGGGYGGWYCPYCGQQMGPGGGYGMGPGMMGGGYGYGMGPGMMGRGMGPGMMGHGYGMGPGIMGPGYGYGPQYQQPHQQPQKLLEEKEAKAILENYLRSTRNPNLKLGKINEQGNYFETEITTKEGSLVDKILVDRYTGWIRSIY